MIGLDALSLIGNYAFNRNKSILILHIHLIVYHKGMLLDHFCS